MAASWHDLVSLRSPCGRRGRMHMGRRATRNGSQRRRKKSAAPAIGLHALIRQPDAVRQLAGLPEHVYRNAAARIPVAADPQEMRLEQRHEPLADTDRAILVKGAMIAERGEVQLERLGFHQPIARYVVDHEVREVWLACDGAQRREFGGRETSHIKRVCMWIAYALEHRLVRALGQL